jgi:Xaa-Pro aminopeptidase
MSMMTRRASLTGVFPPGVDAFLVTGLPNVRYLSGFTGSNAALLVRKDGEAVLATDGRYAVQAAAECSDVEVTVTRSPGPALVSRAVADRVRRLAIENHRVTLSQFAQLEEAVDAAVEFVDAEQAVERLRAVKDSDEIAVIAAACHVTDETFAAVLDRIRPGVTELDIDWDLRRFMHERGAEPAFDSIVAFGPNSAEPHHSPTKRELATGDLVKLDFGAAVAGYHSDMTRTVVCGQPADWQRELHDLVRVVQEEACALVQPGAVPVELDATVRDRIEATGHEVAHGLGHGVGLEIHESPFLVPGSTAARLVDRVAVTVEPGIYLPGRGGVRIEDTVLVGAAGAESLTSSPRELICL